MDIEKLVERYPTLEIKNRTSIPQHLPLLNDSVTIQGGVTRKVSAALFHQIPDISLFEMISPTLFDLHAAGVVNLGTEKASEPAADSNSSTKAGAEKENSAKAPALEAPAVGETISRKKA